MTETKTEATTEVGLTLPQRSQVNELIQGYFGSEEAAKRAQAAAKKAIDWQLEDGMKAKLAAIMEAEPLKLMETLFQRSGQVIKTQASQEFDAIIAAIVKDEDSGIPAAIRQHVKDNLVELVQRSVSEVVTSMLVDYLRSTANGLTDSTRGMIQAAFMNASMTTRY